MTIIMSHDHHYDHCSSNHHNLLQIHSLSASPAGEREDIGWSLDNLKLENIGNIGRYRTYCIGIGI